MTDRGSATTWDYPVEDWTLIEPAFDLAAANDHWLLFVRDPGVPLPAER